MSISQITFNRNNKNYKFEINFDGGTMTSNSGISLIGEFISRIGLPEVISTLFSGYCNNRKFGDDQIIMQKILQCIAGYYTDDAADYLANDPMLTRVCHMETLASQPTLSRFNSRASNLKIIDAESVLKYLRDVAYSLKPQSRVIMDIDTTILPTYGSQDGGEYVYHYDAVGYHPILCYDGLTGDILRSELRDGNTYCGKDSHTFVKPLLEEYKERNMHVTVRGDSGFAMPELYDMVESYDNADYVIRVKKNTTLANKLHDELEALKQTGKSTSKIGEFMYKAKSWEKERRIVYKLDVNADGQQELFASYMFIVTNVSAEPKEVIKLYCKRGNMENFIKECKNEFGFRYMSSTNRLANELRLQIDSIAYAVLNLFRRICLPKTWIKYRANELRLRIMRIAGRVVRTSGKVIFKLCEHYPYKEDFIKIYNNICLINTINR